MQTEVREITSRGEWLEWRRTDLTASRIAALFDCHPYMTRDDLARVLRGEGRGDRDGDTPAMRAGRILEPAVAAAVAEEHPNWQITKATTYHRVPRLRLGATPDYFVGDDGLIQAKTVSREEWEKWCGRPPLGYTLQALTELIVTGRSWGVLAVLIRAGNFPLHLFDVPRHAAAEQRILDAVRDWWRAWDAGDLAPAAPSGGLAEAFDDGSTIDLTGDNMLPDLLAERADLKTSIGLAEHRVVEIDTEIKAKIGAARTAYLPGWIINYASQHRKEAVIPAKDFRVLRIRRSDE